MPQGACQEEIDLATARHPDATSIDVTCSIPLCDRTGGAGTVVVTLANGAKVTKSFAYTGNPAPMPAPVCTGMAMDLCRRIAAAEVDGVPPSRGIRAISIACTSSSCTQDRGEVDVRIQFADGSEVNLSYGWEGGLP